MMKVSHILYKVNDLDAAVKAWQDKGFVVEYGQKDHPHNALIYFSEGPYLELFHHAAMPIWAKWLLRLMGHSKVLALFERWHTADEGLIAVCLENNADDFTAEQAVLKAAKQRFFTVNSKRLDTHDRLLTFKCLFPHEHKLPFLMTCFNIDPKPKNFVHPNGISRITQIAFGTTEALQPTINELCDDPTMTLFIGEGVKDLQFDQPLSVT